MNLSIYTNLYRLRQAGLVLFCLSGISLFAQVPVPDAFYHFDETTGNVIEDHSGNGNHAWWYNYNQQNPGNTERTGWRPTDGIRGGAGYFNGDHVYCGNPCSSGSDLVIFKTSALHSCDDEIPANNMIFQQDLNKFTISFWFKNNWNYLCESGAPAHQCHEQNSGCAWERQVLLSMGGGNTGLILETFAGTTFPALIRLTIAGGDKEKRVVINAHHPPFYENKWVHYAIVFEGDLENNTGKVRFYLDFNLVNNGERDTSFGSVPGHESSFVFGAQTGSSVTDFNIGGECWPEIRELCGITAEQVGRLRYGWLARGWIDDFAFWAGNSLTKNELIEFNESLTTSLESFPAPLDFSIAPSFSNGTFRIIQGNTENFDIELFNSIGQSVSIIYNRNPGQEIMLPEHLKNGIYFITLRKQGVRFEVKKFILNR